MAPKIREYEKPKLIAKMIAREDPKTDPMPLTPHILGTYCSRPDSASSFIPKGKGIPMKNPKGVNKRKEINILVKNGVPRKKTKTCFRNRI